MGQGSLWYNCKFVLQRHTLPISRVDTIEASTLMGCLFLRVYLHVLFSPAKLRRVFKYLIINDIHSFSFHFPVLHRWLKLKIKPCYFANGFSWKAAWNPYGLRSQNDNFNFKKSQSRMVWIVDDFMPLSRLKIELS